MTLLNQGKHIECQKLFDLIFMTLKKHQKSSEDGQDQIMQLMGLTLNNLSCSYRKNGQINDAQYCLQ